jgi:hypothetical protein
LRLIFSPVAFVFSFYIPVVELAARAARCSSSRASSTYKGMRKPEFQKIGRINAALFTRSAFLRPKIFWILVRLSMSCRRMSR